MENWGLITYRLTSLLYDKHKSSDSNKQWVAVVVAHELAHQVCKLLKKSVCESVRKSTEKFGDCLGLCLSSGAGFFSLLCFIIFAFALAYVAESFFYFQCFNCKFFCLCFFCVLVHVS